MTLRTTQLQKAPIILLMVLLCYTFAGNNTFASSATVQNNVSVTSSGGTSKSSVKTVINGEVVEDTTITSDDGSIEYSKTITADGSTTTVTTSASSSEERIAAMQATIEKLISLLQYYVSLLKTQ